MGNIISCVQRAENLQRDHLGSEILKACERLKKVDLMKIIYYYLSINYLKMMLL